jgi:hypothetical protein
MGSEYSTEAEAPAVGRSASASAGTNTVTGSSNASSNDDSCHSIQRAAYNAPHHTTGGVQQTPALKQTAALKSQASSNEDSCAAPNRTVAIRRQRGGYLRLHWPRGLVRVRTRESSTASASSERVWRRSSPLQDQADRYSRYSEGNAGRYPRIGRAVATVCDCVAADRSASAVQSRFRRASEDLLLLLLGEAGVVGCCCCGATSLHRRRRAAVNSPRLVVTLDRSSL